MIKKYFKKESAGYTIIETMIAVSLFIVVVITGMGTLLSANSLNQKSQDMRSIMDNLSFIMEDMSRNLRTGYDYRCITDPSDLSGSVVSNAKSGPSCWGIAFESALTASPVPSPNDQWVYYIGPDSSLPAPQPLGIWKSTAGPYNPSSFTKLNPDEVIIDAGSYFSVLGAEGTNDFDTQQPLIGIRLIGTVLYKGVATPFSLQTSVSQRLLDV